MSEQWFLDLDGVRSGPYQTSEVMSLVAEGEILPHHQIATELKSQKWMTILEWRLNQNKMTEPKKESVSITPAPVSFTPPVEAQKPQTHTPTAAPITTPPSDPSKPKRDPMAEMFDMLQNTKQKREVKSQQAHAHSHTATSVAYSSVKAAKKNKTNGNWGKTFFIGLIITIVGFALGQYFQNKRSRDLPAAVTIAPTPSAPVTITTKAVMSPSPSSEERLGTIDRSTDKMTIRAQVPAEHGKDIEDLKDLKKELMELKALKEEIRNNNDSAPPLDQPLRKNDLNGESDPNAIEEPMDERANPDVPAGDDVHY